jgi:3-hydroxyisobutyrate dehydrogenase-like beta-hydroxyacid dehydrogenase
MLKVRGPMIVSGDFTAQMKLDLFMKDIHLMQEAAEAVGAPFPSPTRPSGSMPQHRRQATAPRIWRWS